MKDPKKVEAGRALASKVSRDYYRFIGRRGGRATKLKDLLWLSETYDCRNDPAWLNSYIGRTSTPAQAERWNRWTRQRLAEDAERYRDMNGTRMMIELFDPQFDIKKKRKKRGM